MIRCGGRHVGRPLLACRFSRGVPVHLKLVKPYGEKQAERFAKLAPNALLIRPGEEVELV